MTARLRSAFPMLAPPLLLLAGCIGTNDNAAGTEGADDTGSVTADRGPSTDATPSDAAAPLADAAAPPADRPAPPADLPDAAAPDAAAPDPCPAACAHLVTCSLSLCPGLTEADGPAVEEECRAQCAANPSVPILLDPARECAEVVDFGRIALGPDYQRACRVREVPWPDGGECPLPCAEGEVCTGGHCVRPAGDCLTDYHCYTGREICRDGKCVPAQLSPCFGEGDCSPPELVCRGFGGDPQQPGFCAIPCADDATCPLHETCQDMGGPMCFYTFCGGAEGNGTLRGACQVGERPGVCIPLPAGDVQPGGSPGLCLEGGAVAEGGPCDEQAQGRTPADAALRCAPGLLCLGDPDQPLDPQAPLDGRGRCTPLCDPAAPACGPQSVCIDISTPDNPGTPDFDETRRFGFCLAGECALFPAAGEPDCAEGETCRAVAVQSAYGLCGEIGPGAADVPCTDAGQCGAGMICSGDAANPGECLLLCDPAGEAPDSACPDGRQCYSEPGWQIGACVPAPGGGQ